MSSFFLEVVQLPDGDIVLQRVGEEAEPLVSIRFSEESFAYIGDAGLDIAKIMIQSGIQAVAHINEAQARDKSAQDVAMTLEDLAADNGEHGEHGDLVLH
ncbi:MAG: hypothetical protein V3T17_14820 [Pseudomonadales bacterium]